MTTLMPLLKSNGHSHTVYCWCQEPGDTPELHSTFISTVAIEMKILELEISNISNIQYVNLKFDMNNPRHNSPVYLIASVTKCKALTLAIQLICSSKYDKVSKLHNIGDQIKNGKVSLTFTLQDKNKEHATNDAEMEVDHSSDSDVPCTSFQAAERARKRLAHERMRQQRTSTIIVIACRNFGVNPGAIEYTVNNGPHTQCPVDIFHKRFFSCTDIIFPRLSELTNYNGRWLDLLSLDDFIYKGKGEHHLIVKFCELYARRNGRITLQDQLSQLTTAVLTSHYCLNQSRISQLIYIFQDIRCVFEYITCSEYTVWFLLPTEYGHLRDITEITTNNVNFDLMKTKIQLKTGTTQTGQHIPAPSPKFLWTESEGYVKELFLVAVQLVFGYHCRQNIIFLNNLVELNRHQSFEYIRTAYARNSRNLGQLTEKNYLQHIINVCVKLDLSCVLEYAGGIPLEPKNSFIIESEKGYRTKYVTISLKRPADDATEENNMRMLHHELKTKSKKKFVRFHPDAKLE